MFHLVSLYLDELLERLQQLKLVGRDAQGHHVAQHEAHLDAHLLQFRRGTLGTLLQRGDSRQCIDTSVGIEAHGDFFVYGFGVERSQSLCTTADRLLDKLCQTTVNLLGLCYHHTCHQYK